MLEKPPSLRRWQEVSQGSSWKFVIKKDAPWYGVGLVGCVGLNPKFARGCSIGSPKVQEVVMGKDWNARVSETMKE
jgi:hypothetical protein